MIGEVIGNFCLLSRLGSGGMGEVYLAEHNGIQTRVAVKVLHPEISRDHHQVQRFFNEAKIVGRIKHAGIVKIFDVGFHRDHAYLIMELLEGESLAKRIERVGQMSAAMISDIGRQIASVLEATHRAGVIHRDLKPDNIFLVADDGRASRERVKILDFGIAKLSGTLAGNSPKTHGTMGTPTYMAPEQWGNSAQVDWRADVYSLGCVAYEMACGQPPFIANNIAEAYTKHLNEPVPSACARAPGLPPVFDMLIASLLAKKPDDRPASMSAIAQMFEALGGASASLAQTVGKLPTRTTASPIAPTMSAALPITETSSSPASVPGATPRTTLNASSGEVTRQAMKKKPIALVATAIGAAIGAVVIIIAARDNGPPPAAASPTDSAATGRRMTGTATTDMPTNTTTNGRTATTDTTIPTATSNPTTGSTTGLPTNTATATTHAILTSTDKAPTNGTTHAATSTPTVTATASKAPTKPTRPLKSPTGGTVRTPGSAGTPPTAGSKPPTTDGVPPPPTRMLDSDGDGIPDAEDRCPLDAGPASTRGCPDRDGDGVADMDDDCPSVPGPANNHGCPLSKPPEKPPAKGSDSALDGRT